MRRSPLRSAASIGVLAVVLLVAVLQLHVPGQLHGPDVHSSLPHAVTNLTTSATGDAVKRTIVPAVATELRSARPPAAIRVRGRLAVQPPAQPPRFV